MAAAERRDESPLVGFIGCPPEEALAPWRSGRLIDLDNVQPGVRTGRAETLLPATTCRIIKRILDNALELRPAAIVFDDGYSKCDNARFLGRLLRDLLPETELICTQNDNRVGVGVRVCDSTLPLAQKVGLILDEIVSAQDLSGLQACQNPPAAFWGVPCADDAVYELFPAGTQVLGWLRCFENRTPADLDLECWVPSGVPTVFFAQTFCSKNILARHLARRHHGLYVDIDGGISRSERAKIEAFLHFRKAGN